jgi:hypothetical protein
VTEALDFVSRANAGVSTVDSNDVRVIDDSLLSTKTRIIMDEVFFGRELSTPSASNKRILTVGLPSGLIHRVQRRAVATDSDAYRAIVTDGLQVGAHLGAVVAGQHLDRHPHS